jgi:Leucine-rich repeat (LRR) protein
MPLDNHFLERIKMNDATLKRLDLNGNGLNAQDIQELVKALATNITLTTLNVGGNQIGDEGAIALSANTTLTTLSVEGNQIGDKGAKAIAANTTLTTLNLESNEIGVEGAKALSANTTLTTLKIGENKMGDEEAKALAANTTLSTLNVENNYIGDEGAKALAANTTLTELEIGYNQIGAEGATALSANTTLTTLKLESNQIGDEGAKALAANITLTTLDVGDNQMSKTWEDKLNDAIDQNRKQVIKRRDQFIQSLFILARDRANPHSQSLSHQLPKDIILQMINMIDFRPTESIGKSVQQIKACAAFIFNHTVEMNESLAKAVEEKQDFKLVEKMVDGKQPFGFFPAKVAIKAQEKESNENVTKIKKIM